MCVCGCIKCCCDCSIAVCGICPADLHCDVVRADDDAPDRAMKRIQQFQSLGTEEWLRDMLQDMSLDVRERVSTALNNFGCTSSDTSEF